MKNKNSQNKTLSQEKKAGPLSLLSRLLFPWWFDEETEELNEEVRRDLPGEFATLSQGVTHFELQGPSDGKKVVLIHGFSSPYYIWNPLYPALPDSGLRLLRFDLYGRGFSDRPRTRYGPHLYCRQLEELLDYHRWNEPVTLVGLSMGGAISLEFARRYPHRVDSLVLIAPGGFAPIPLKARLVCLPLVGDYLNWALGTHLIVEGTSKSFAQKDFFKTYRPLFLAQTKYKGYRRAILSTLRHMPLGNMKETYREVGGRNLAIDLIWGTEDEIIPFALADKVLTYLSQANLHGIEGAGHCPHCDAPEEVIPLLKEILLS